MRVRIQHTMCMLNAVNYDLRLNDPDLTECLKNDWNLIIKLKILQHVVVLFV